MNKPEMKPRNIDKLKSPCQNMYTVQDVVAQRFSPPTLSQNDQTAIRDFRIFLQDTNVAASRNPQDFRLWHLGDFDPDDGQIDVLDQPLMIFDGAALK